MTFTPGPWKLDKDRSTVRIPKDGHNVYAAYCGTAANATLIAAAPDLLEACEAFVSSLVKTKEIVEQARAAIEKATS